jgi:nucleoside-diphosphate-sugar epimerase
VIALVTGAAGFLGSRVVARLRARGEVEAVRCLHRPGSDTGRLEPALSPPGPDAEVLAGNLLSPADCARAVAGVDLVVHCAAGLTGAPATIIQDTVVATRNLLDAVISAGRAPRFVLVSSFGVYGMSGVPEGTVVREDCPLEPHPERRDAYSFAKLRQERLAWEYRARHGLRLTVLRPGVVYGPGGTAVSARVGLRVAGLFLHLGRRNLLPVTFVENCADAIALAAAHPGAEGEVYDVVDDDLPSAGAWLSRYRAEVEPLRVVSLPLGVTRALARALAWYHERSRGQLPAPLTPYRVEALWRSYRYDNAKLKALGWCPAVPTAEGLARTFAALRARAA